MKNKRTLGDFRKLLNKFLHNRYDNKDDLEMILSNYFDFGVSLDLSNHEQSYYSDYRLLANFSLGKDKIDLYLDIYYIFDRQEKMYITEYSLDGEHPLEKSYDELFIVGLSR